jgi:membrane protein insertase Oxa1/YidC/SpoIIIJ
LTFASSNCDVSTPSGSTYPNDSDHGAFLHSDNFPPIWIIQQLHESIGMSWWMSIASCTWMLRCSITLPLQIYTMRQQVR